jgi:hypothetical protein
MKNSILSQLLGNTINTVTNWRNEQRPIIVLLEKYFQDSEIEKFLDTGKITRLEEGSTQIVQNAQKSIGIVRDKATGIKELNSKNNDLKFFDQYSKLEQIASWGNEEGINDLNSELDKIKQILLKKYA